MKTRKNETPSIQGADADAINITSGDFSLPNGAAFVIFNNNSTTVPVKILPIDSSTGNWVDFTIGAYGWLPMLCKAVKQDPNVENLKWVM